MCDAESALKPDEDFGKFNNVQPRIIPLLAQKVTQKKNKQQMHTFYISHRTQIDFTNIVLLLDLEMTMIITNLDLDLQMAMTNQD